MPILSLLKHLWPRADTCREQPDSSLLTPEIRFYLVHTDWSERGHPAYRGGYPGRVSGQWLLHEYQQPLRERILHSIGMPADELERYVEPLLSRFAELAHLLPASENQHHCGPGGLLRQGLEVAALVLDGCLTTAFDADDIPARRSLRLRRWYVAGVAAALLRCLGKPLAEVRASDFEERRHWVPTGETLQQWSGGHRLSRYFLEWRSAGHAEHAQATLAQVARIVAAPVRDWLDEGGEDIQQALLDAATAQGNAPLSGLVNQAWATSCRGRSGQGASAAVAASIPRRAVEVMSRLLRDGTWQVNVAGGRVWVAEDGVYVAWNQGAGEIVAGLLENDSPVVPRSPETLIGLLVEHGIAQRAPRGEPYWLVTPHLLQRNGRAPTLRCMKLASAELLFPAGTLPAPVAVSLGKAARRALPVAPCEAEPESAPVPEKTPQRHKTPVPTTASPGVRLDDPAPDDGAAARISLDALLSGAQTPPSTRLPKELPTE